MSTQVPDRGRDAGLAAVRALERRLDQRANAGEAAKATVAAARERAERVVADARARGEERARRRRAEALAAAEREEKAIRRRAQEQGDELRAALRRERGSAVAALVELVLPRRAPEAER